MTDTEKFRKGVVVYATEDDYICELWGASTKHPDAFFQFSNWEDKNLILSWEDQVFQWLLWIASTRMWPFHAKEITEIALKDWYKWG